MHRMNVYFNCNVEYHTLGTVLTFTDKNSFWRNNHIMDTLCEMPTFIWLAWTFGICVWLAPSRDLKPEVGQSVSSASGRMIHVFSKFWFRSYASSLQRNVPNIIKEYLNMRGTNGILSLIFFMARAVEFTLCTLGRKIDNNNSFIWSWEEQNDCALQQSISKVNWENLYILEMYSSHVNDYQT